MDQVADISRQTSTLKNELTSMGAMVKKALSDSIEALKNRNLTIARRIMADDAKINERRYEIENQCIDLIAENRVSKVDLRGLVGIMNIIIELERIGDYAEGIAKIVILIGDEPPLKPLIDIPRMMEITVEMVDISLKSFISGDMESANKVISMDNTVDNLYDQIFRELLTFMMVDPKTISRATRLIWVAHNLERAADRATNISERVIYTVTGKIDESGSSRY
jgi:phosphate transport system protein